MTVIFGMPLVGFLGVMVGMMGVALRGDGVMGRLFVMPLGMMFGRLMMMLGRLLVMLGRLLVMLRCFLGHERFLQKVIGFLGYWYIPFVSNRHGLGE